MGIGSRIDAIRKEKKLSLRKLSIDSGIPYSTLYSAVKRDSTGIDFETLKKIAAVLDVPWYTLISDNSDKQAEMIETDNLISKMHDSHSKFMQELPNLFNVDMFREVELEKLVKDYEALNEEGQQVAVERVHELTEIPRYQRKDTSEE